MNITPRSPTAYPNEFLQLIRHKSSNFVGREFVFAAIADFLHRQSCGYFTIMGPPGSGKSAILAKYATENPQVVYYSAEVEGKNRAEEFLSTICTQLIRGMGNTEVLLPDNATDGSWFLSLLLQKISDRLEPNSQLIIAIDGCDRIEPNNQPPGTNLFYLPRYLPDQVYFILTRRLFLREKSGLLIETPSQIFDLAASPELNQQDLRKYIQQYLTTQENVDNAFSILTRDGENLKSWLTTHNISQQEFCQQLTVASANNFMYLSEILRAIAQGCYPEPFHFDPLPPGLQTYYQNHWQRMQGEGLSSVALAVLNIIVQQKQPLSTELIAQMIDQDEYEVEEVLENWLQFLEPQQIGGETFYSFYHSSFRDWLDLQLISCPANHF